MKSTTKEVIKRPLVELLEELKTKITLLEGDRRAYYESSYVTMQQNREKIGYLRKDLYELRKTLWDKTHSDLTVVSQAFQNRPVEKSAFSNKPSKIVIDEMDFRVSDSMKRFNLVQYATQRKRKRVEVLADECRKWENENSGSDLPKAALKNKQHIRDLENRYEKLMLKNNECEFIQQTYRQIYDRLFEEKTRANSVLNEMETDIRRCRAEKVDLIAIHNDASKVKEIAVTELERLEEFAYADRKRRDIELMRMQKVSQEHKQENERCDKKSDDDGTGALSSDEYNADEDDATKSSSSSYNSLDDNIQRLKVLTGIPDLGNMVVKFENQLQVKHKLITLINKMEAHINCNRETRYEHHQKLEQLKLRMDHSARYVHKHSGTKKMEARRKVSEVDKVSENFNSVSELVSSAKFGLEHLMEKLIHVKIKNKSATSHNIKPTTTEEYVMDLFKRLYHKIRQLLLNMQPHDANEFLEKMTMEQMILFTPQIEVEDALKKQVPHFNIRRVIFESNDNGDDDESGDDDNEWLSRDAMKVMSADFIEAKTRKNKNRRKKKAEQKKIA